MAPVKFPVKRPIFGTPLAISRDGMSIFVNILDEDTLRLTNVPLDGSMDRTLFAVPFPLMSFYIDAAADGSLYVDHVARPSVILEFAESGNDLKTTSVHYTGSTPGLLPLADGRYVTEDVIAGKTRLVIGGARGEFSSFLTTDEESAVPVSPPGMVRSRFESDGYPSRDRRCLAPESTRPSSVASERN